MTSLGKNSAAAKRAIQEMGASLFYAKVRGEDISAYENLTSEEKIASGQKISSSENLSTQENISSHKNLSSEFKKTSDENLTTNKTFASEESLTSEIKGTSYDNIPTQEKLADDKNLDSEEKLSSIEILSSEEKISGNKYLCGEEKISSDKNLTNKRNKSGKENLPRNLPSNKKISYESPLLAFITEVGLSGVCVAIALRHLLPAEGGKIRIGALSRSLNMSSNNIRLHLETLQTKGVIASANGDQQGRIIKFLHPFLLSQKGVGFFAESESATPQKQQSSQQGVKHSLSEYVADSSLK